jgi:hypothetical protein
MRRFWCLFGSYFTTEIAMQQPQNDEFELTIADAPELRAPPGFHETRTRVYYVTAAGAVYLLAAPGQRAMLQAVDHLPPEAMATGAVRDLRLRTLAEVAEDLAPMRPCAPLHLASP